MAAKKESNPVYSLICYSIMAISVVSIYNTYTDKNKSSNPPVASNNEQKTNQSATPANTKNNKLQYDELTDEQKFSFVADNSYSAMACESLAKSATKYPSKAKMDWGAKVSKVYWTDGTSTERGVINVVKRGEAMNSFGAMIPFVAQCQFGVNLETKKAFLKSFTFDGQKII